LAEIFETPPERRGGRRSYEETSEKLVIRLIEGAGEVAVEVKS